MTVLRLVLPVALIAACSGSDAVDSGYSYSDIQLPAHYSEVSPNGMGGGMGPPGFDAAIGHDNTPDDNPITDAGAALGRVLFYDVDLSQNRTVACSSCHIAERGFSDDKVLSDGFDGGQTGRHSMGLTNARFYGPGKFFWDQRADSLEDQVLMPLQDPVEMGMTLEEVVARVEEEPRYAPMFDAAFGSAKVDSDKISRSLAQFVRSMVSTTSRYDEGRAKVDGIRDPFPNFTEQENLGKELFYAPPPHGGMVCAHCHGTDAQVAYSARSNGLDATVTDQGYGAVSESELDLGAFKVPSLRNVGVRAPYMHDGRFESLEAVVDHYSDHIQYHQSLPHFLIRSGDVTQLHMTDDQKAALVAFLHTLTDEEMLTHPRYSDPEW